MKIDQIDLKIIRQIESHGLNSLNYLTRHLSLSVETIRGRIRKLEDNGFIGRYVATLFYPPILGGEWHWALAQMETRKPLLDLERELQRIIPFTTEISYHQYIAIGSCPNVTVLFYTKELRKTLIELRRLKGIDYVEVYKIKKYSFPVKRELSQIEWWILNGLVQHPNSAIEDLAEHVSLTDKEVSAKLGSLLWNEENRRGIVLILPNLDWTKITNFTHLHVGLETSLKEAQLTRLLKARRLNSVPYTPWFKKKYFQVEADIWELQQLLRFFTALRKIKNIDIMGVVMVSELKIFEAGVGKFIQNFV